jgi:hypothetical protein
VAAGGEDQSPQATSARRDAAPDQTIGPPVKATGSLAIMVDITGLPLTG